MTPYHHSSLGSYLAPIQCITALPHVAVGRMCAVQVANLFGRGADKLAFSGENGREQFAEDHLGQIMDSADDPFGGER